MAAHHHHHHDPHHGHHHQDGDTVSEVNRKHWDEKAAAKYAEPWIKALTAQQTSTLATHASWLGLPPVALTGTEPTARLLDYAGGNGAVSLSLLDRFGTLRAIDASDTMVRLYTATAQNAGLSPDRMAAFQGNLLDPSAPSTSDFSGPDWSSFDAIIICMALHHIADPGAMLKALANRLAPGGTLIAVDWSTENGEVFEEVKAKKEHLAKMITRQGFSEEDMVGLFGEAGFERGECGYRLFDERSTIPEADVGVEGGVSWRMFVARARKAA